MVQIIQIIDPADILMLLLSTFYAIYRRAKNSENVTEPNKRTF